MSRNLLAQHKLEAFAQFAEKHGAQVDRRPVGAYQMLGIRKGGPWMYVYRQEGKSVHYTVDHRMEKLVREFIKETRKNDKTLSAAHPAGGGEGESGKAGDLQGPSL